MIKGHDWCVGDTALIGPFPDSDASDPIEYSTYDGMTGLITTMYSKSPEWMNPPHDEPYAVLQCPEKMDYGKPPQTIVPLRQLLRPT